jgi:hypothetical protein
MKKLIRALTKNKKLLVGILIGLIVLALVAVGTLQVLGFKKALAAKDGEIQQLKQTIQSIGQLTTVYVVRAEVPAGKEIVETDLQPVTVPVSMASNAVTDLNTVKGKYYKTSLTPGSLLLADLVMEDKLDPSMRLYDIVTDENPLGLKPGTYVDVRISMPFGEDFIAMSHKRVYAINNGILKLAVNEQDIHTYNSMLVDKILYPGTRIYAVEYLEPGSQQPASKYYPVSKNVLAIAEKDPNLLSAIEQDMIARRTQLEASLKSMINPEIANIIENGKQKITQAISESDKEIQRRWQQEEAERKALEAQQAAQQSVQQPAPQGK